MTICPHNSNCSILLYSNIYKVPFHLKHSLIFKILFISCYKNGINIDGSFYMTVNKNSVHHRGLFPFEIFRSMVNTEKIIASADVHLYYLYISNKHSAT